MSKIIDPIQLPVLEIVKPKVVDQKLIEPVKYYRINPMTYPKSIGNGLKPQKNKESHE